MNAGIVLLKDDAVARNYATRFKLALCVAADWVIPWHHTLFITPGTCVAWNLLPMGFRFLERWDLAAPFWRDGMLAKDVGQAVDRERTQSILHDLRVPLYAHELLFVRDSDDGRAFMASWRAECAKGDERLAFLRALYMVKPRFCVLPRLWLTDIAQHAERDRAAAQQRRMRNPPQLIQVEVAPGRFVQCYPQDRDKVLERYQRMARRRHAG